MAQVISQADHHAFLARVAESLVEAVVDRSDGLLVHVDPAPDGAQVSVLPLEGRAPADALLGVVAPEHWSALGVATRGRTFDTSATTEVVVLVARDGEVVSRVRHAGRLLTEPPAYGLTLDGLQRALGLPTASPAVPATHLLAITWLERVLEAARRRPLSWSEMCDLHPAGGAAGATRLPRLSPELEGMFEWGRLRQLVIDGRWPEPRMSPEDAEWFDDGSFSRWILSRRPSVPDLLAELRAVIGRADARRCATALRRAGVDIEAF